MKFLKALLCSLLVFSVLGCGSVSAAPIKKVLTVNKSYKMEFNSPSNGSPSRNTSWNEKYELPLPETIMAVTKINGTIKPLGQAKSFGVDFGRYISFGGTWYDGVSDPLNKEMSPSASAGLRDIKISASTDREYNYYGAEVFISTIEYIEYPMSVSIAVTKEKYAQITVKEVDGNAIPRLRIMARAITDGNRELEANGTTIIDSAVQIGKTYRYHVFAAPIVTDWDHQRFYLGAVSVLIPTPADETKEIAEQARDAAREASQNASV
jgi:hypothetical protein